MQGLRLVLTCALLPALSVPILAAGWTNKPQSVYADQYLRRCPDVVVAHLSTKAVVGASVNLETTFFSPGLANTEYEFELIVDKTLKGKIKPGPVRVYGLNTPSVKDAILYWTHLSDQKIWTIEPSISSVAPVSPMYHIATLCFSLKSLPFVEAVTRKLLDNSFRDLFNHDSASKIRALYFLSGGPFEGGEGNDWPVDGYSTPYVELANLAEQSVEDADPEVRQTALMALDRIEGPGAVTIYRRKLADQDLNVRSVAAAVLLKNRDALRLDTIESVIGQMPLVHFSDKGVLAVPFQPLAIALNALHDRKDENLVPILIELVDCPTKLVPFRYLGSNEWAGDSPSKIVEHLLTQILGRRVPPNRILARSLWDRAKSQPNPLEAMKKLLLPYQVNLICSTNVQGNNWVVKLRNPSSQTLWISSSPKIELVRKLRNESDTLVKLVSGASVEYTVPVDASSEFPVTLTFTHFPKDPNRIGWVGTIEAPYP